MRRRLRVGAAVALLAVVAVLAVVPLVTLTTVASRTFNRDVPRFDGTIERIRSAEIGRPFVLPYDSLITPLQAGQAFYALQPLGRAGASIRMQPHAQRPPLPWIDDPLRPVLFKTATQGSSWEGPSSRSILEAVGRGFSSDEIAYLQMVATAPVWQDWGVIARARAGDIAGASLVLPFSKDATADEVPIPRFAATKELAYASVSRAAYFMARKQPDSAEVALRETISAGFFIADNAPTVIHELIGLVIVDIGLDGLVRFYALSHNAAGPRLKAAYDSVLAARTGKPRAIAMDGGGPAAAQATSEPAVRRQLVASVTDPSIPRAVRLDLLGALSISSCTNIRELLFGPNEDIRDAFARARKELVRYPSDAALIELREERAERGFPRDKRPLGAQLMLGAASIEGAVLHNRRIRGCTELLLPSGRR